MYNYKRKNPNFNLQSFTSLNMWKDIKKKIANLNLIVTLDN